MKARTFLACLILSGVMLLLGCFLTAGCRSSSAVDWNKRVGTFTYDQAVAELGQPERTENLGNGRIEADWIKFTNIGFGYGMGSGTSGGNGPIGMGQTVGAGYNSKVLTLVFGPDKKLISWSKNY